MIDLTCAVIVSSLVISVLGMYIRYRLTRKRGGERGQVSR